MENQIKPFFIFVFGSDFPGLLPIWTKQTKETAFFDCSHLQEAESHIHFKAQSNDLLFGLGLLENQTYANGSRGKVDDVIAIPGFFMDLDIQSDNDNDTKYPPNTEEALRILNYFPLEPSLINKSGHGLHVFWLFKKLWIFEDENDKKLAISTSRTFQETLIKLYAKHGYKLNNVGDLARIPRIPGTFNHKYSPPAPVECLTLDSKNQPRYSLEEINSAVAKCSRRERLNLTRPRNGKNTPVPKRSFPESDGHTILKRCKWFMHCYKDSQTLSEPEWFFMQTVASFCKDATTLACELSKDYPNYSEKETLDKVNRIQKSNYNPVSCAYVKANFAGWCDNCPHTVKSPFLLGISKTKSDLEQIGFEFDDNGNVNYLNGNIFARYILTRFNLIISRDGRFYLFRNGVWIRLEPEQVKRMLRDLLHEFAPDFWTKKWEDFYLEALKREAPYVSALNTNRNYLNLLNGMLDLDTFELLPHQPEYYSSSQLPIKFDATATCPTYDQFISDIFEGDKETDILIEEIEGYCLTAETSAHKAFLFYGKGANGKSMLAEVMRNLCGEQNTSAVSLADLSNSFRRYNMVGKLLNLATENEFSPTGINTEEFKKIVVGETILVEKKFEQSFEYNPICKLVFSLNNLPYSRDKSFAFQRRFIIIPFNRTFREEDPATQVYSVLKKRLLDEMPGILNRALTGLKRLRENKYIFSHSTVSDEFEDEYQSLINPHKQFIDEMIEQGDDTDHISNETMLKVFTRWCASHRHNKIGNSSDLKIHHDIRNTLRDLRFNFEVGKGCKAVGKRGYKGIRLRVLNTQEPDSDFAGLED